MATMKPVGSVVDSPSVVAAPHGLINRLTLQEDDDRWEGGVGFESLSCAAKVEVWGLCDDTGTVISDGTGQDRGVYAVPFGVTATDTCTSTMNGAAFRDEAAARAKILLEGSAQKAVEAELKWGYAASAGTPPGRWLTDPQTVVVDSAGVCPKVAVALLEDAYAACAAGGGGMLHMTPGTASALRGLSEDDGVLFTRSGTPVIAGAGYAVPRAGSGADPAWDGSWMFITGPVLVWLGDVQVYPGDLGQAIDVATNDIRFKAEQLAAVTFDGCCAFAVKVDLTSMC